MTLESLNIKLTLETFTKAYVKAGMVLYIIPALLILYLLETIPKNEDVVKEGDEEEKLNPPNYEELPKVKKAVQEPVKDPVVVAPEVSKETSDDRGNNLVTDSENPFLRLPSEVPSNGNRGEIESNEYSDYVPNTGDKF